MPTLLFPREKAILESWITNNSQQPSLGPGDQHSSGTAWGSVPGLHSWGLPHHSCMEIPFRGVFRCPHTFLQHRGCCGVRQQSLGKAAGMGHMQ